MTNFQRYMHQAATYWAPANNDGFGGMTFSSPVEIMCRWQNTATMFRDSFGREVVSDAVVYVDRPLAVGGYLALGTYSDANPRDVDGAKEIRQVMQSPSLMADEVLNKVML